MLLRTFHVNVGENKLLCFFHFKFAAIYALLRHVKLDGRERMARRPEWGLP